MAGSYKDYRTWHLQNLRDHKAAAYFLLAALEDALEMDLPKHFIKAVSDVRKANGGSGNPFIYMEKHVSEEDRSTIHALTAQIAGLLMEKAEKENLVEPQLT